MAWAIKIPNARFSVMAWAIKIFQRCFSMMAWAIKISQRCFRVMAWAIKISQHCFRGDGLGHQKFPTLLPGDGLGHQKFPTLLQGDGLGHHLSTGPLGCEPLHVEDLEGSPQPLAAFRSRSAASSGKMSRCGMQNISYPTMNLRTVAERSRGGKKCAWRCHSGCSFSSAGLLWKPIE